MKKAIYVVLGLIVMSFAATQSSAEQLSQDALNERRVLAQDFFDIRPVSEMANNAIASLSLSRPEQERALFIRRMRVNMDYSVIEAEMIEALIKIYTAEEIKAMNDFYGSDLGKSIQDKQGSFQQSITPILQRAMDKAFVEASYGNNGAQSRP